MRFAMLEFISALHRKDKRTLKAMFEKNPKATDELQRITDEWQRLAKSDKDLSKTPIF